MSFRCDPATLERLEWPRFAGCLAACASTIRGAEACGRDLFCATHAGVRERLAETGEARALLDQGEVLPLAGVADLREVSDAVGRGRVVAAAELAQVCSTVEAAERVRGFLEAREERSPRLADLAGTLPALPGLAHRIARVVTPEGQVRDDASADLRKLHHRVRDLQAEIDRRMASYLRDPSVQIHLQDGYVTAREDRPVLPVRADARSRVRGIVHDLSSSGTTVFIEPEAVVELGNRLRVARTEVQREIEHLLRELSERVAENGAAIDAMGATLEVLDVAQARGRLSQKIAGSAPDTDDAAALDLRELRHPLLVLEAGMSLDDVVANDLVLPDSARGLLISGPNAGGKTVAAKAVGLAALSLRAGLHVSCGPGSRLRIPGAVAADIGDDQDLRAGLSTFSARMTNLAGIVGEACEDTLVILDELGEGTEPGEGAAIAQAVLEALVERGATVIATTHFNRLKEMAGSDEHFVNASAEFDPDTLRPTYRIQVGAPGSSGATWVAERMGLPAPVLERAHQLLDHEDRKLEALTRSLSELRQELEVERREARGVREQGEAARALYEARLEKLRVAREEALSAMKSELEGAFQHAREELAGVMRTVQASGAADGKAANRAYRRIESIEQRTAAVEEQHAAAPAPREIIDWKSLQAGARLELEGVSGEATLLEPPNRRGRVVVRVGDARTELPARRVLRVLTAAEAPPAPPRAVSHLAVDREPEPEQATPQCDLRGLRVDEALDRAERHLQRVLGHGVERVRFIHGHGTGALRSAIRAWLRDLPDVSRVEPGGDHEGGNGVTIAVLTH